MSSDQTNFEIRICKADFLTAIAIKNPEKGKKAFLIKGNWLSFFEKEIKNYEKTFIGTELTINLQATKARLNSTDEQNNKSLRSDAGFFRGNAKCKFPCCNVTYSLYVKEKPNQEQNLVNVEVTKRGDHLHERTKEEKVMQIRGEKREEMCMQMKTLTNDSASNFRNYLLGSGVPYNQCPSTETIRKIKSETERKESCGDPILDVIKYGAQSKESHGNEKVPGYVQHFSVGFFFTNIFTFNNQAIFW
jgi:hypothetical protein